MAKSAYQVRLYSGMSGFSGIGGGGGGGASGYSGFSGLIPDPLTGLTIQDVGETVNALGNVSGATTANIQLGNVVTATATGSVSWTFSNPFPSPKSTTLTLVLTNGGAGTQTWPSGTVWNGGSAPPLQASGTDVLVFMTLDGGTSWLASAVGRGVSGYSGAVGSSGYSGAVGSSGYSGAVGTGTSGYSGAVGSSGYSGVSAAIPNPLAGVELKDIGETVNALGNVSGATTANIDNGNIVTATATGAVTWTFSNPFASGKSCTVCLRLTNGGLGTQTWPTGTKWPGGAGPTLTASGLDIIMFNTIDGGTTWAAVLTGANFS